MPSKVRFSETDEIRYIPSNIGSMECRICHAVKDGLCGRCKACRSCMFAVTVRRVCKLCRQELELLRNARRLYELYRDGVRE